VYDDFYGLTGKPFQLTPDHRFFFDSQVHHRAMAYLRYGLEQREGFIVITGGVGTGKTILVRALFGELANREVMAAQLVTTQVGPEDMLRMVSASFGLAHEGMNKATLVHNLEVIARTRFAEGKHILLVVDEAQNLPPASLEELRMLSNFQVEGRSIFQSFLLGQGELRQTLQRSGMEQLRQRTIASYHLDPLSPEDTRAYIEYRLKLVGWNDDPSLDRGAFDRVYELTAGVPRQINALCDRLLLFGCIEAKHSLAGEDVEVVAKEMDDEVGAVHEPAPEPLWEPPKHEPEDEASADISKDAVLPGDAAERIARLEREVARLKQIVQHERKLLRKAVLLQLDLNVYDDLD